jgi:prolyl oligopeptidase
VPEGKDVLQDVTVVGGRIYATYLHDVATVIKRFSLSGEAQGAVPLPGLGSASVSGEIDGAEAFVSFTSFTTPPTVFRDDVKTGARSVWSKAAFDVDPDRFTVSQVWYTSKDGTRVPMFLIHKKGLTPDGNRPVLLYGYGGFNVAITPAFRSTAVVFAEHGGVFAIANIRGGSEFGETWHRAGMLENKQNVFDDFIAVAEHLRDTGVTTPEQLAMHGRSNGGLLVGAVMTQRPDLFAVALPGVGVLDMLRFHKFTVGAAWASDYGLPDDPEQFEDLLAYSPLHRVSDGTAYPATLVTMTTAWCRCTATSSSRPCSMRSPIRGLS